MTKQPPEQLSLWATLCLGIAATFGANSAFSETLDPAQACSKDGYMLVMGGVEDPSTVPDMERAQKYGPAVWDLVESYGAFYMVRKAPDVVYEGDWPDWKAGVISKWPCRETGLTFWHSDAYQNEVKPLRKDAGAYDVGMFNAANPGTPAENQDYVPEACTEPFLIVGLTKVTDAEAYGRYSKAIRASNLPRRAGYKLLFGGQPAEVLEGTWPEGYATMVSLYPCRAAWEAFYTGAPYVSDIKPLRAGAGDFIIVGFEPERVE
jgi:uncharacterized protein (DUF1330 family)